MPVLTIPCADWLGKRLSWDELTIGKLIRTDQTQATAPLQTEQNASSCSVCEPPASDLDALVEGVQALVEGPLDAARDLGTFAF